MNAISNLPTVENLSPTGNWTKQNKIDYVEAVLNATGRNGMPPVLQMLRSTDFYYAPSSANKHCNYVGGLVDHSILVYSLAMRDRQNIFDMNPALAELPELSDESVAISTLLHDVCKICFYKTETKYKKGDHGQWVTYEGYSISDVFPIGHGEKSVIMLQKWGLDLTPQEMMAIRFHMGAWDISDGSAKYAYNNAIDVCKLLPLVQNADYKSSLLLEQAIQR